MEFENLLTLIKTMSGSQLTELKYEENGVKIRLNKNREVVQVMGTGCEAAAMPTVTLTNDSLNTVQSETEKEGNVVTSPLVGIFYAAPAEDAEPFVKLGTQVKKGQSLAIVEAMKLMNEIECEYDGTVAEIYVENGTAVEYGQPLFRII